MPLRTALRGRLFGCDASLFEMSKASNVAMVMVAFVPSASRDERDRDLSIAERHCPSDGPIV